MEECVLLHYLTIIFISIKRSERVQMDRTVKSIITTLKITGTRTHLTHRRIDIDEKSSPIDVTTHFNNTRQHVSSPHLIGIKSTSTSHYSGTSPTKEHTPVSINSIFRRRSSSRARAGITPVRSMSRPSTSPYRTSPNTFLENTTSSKGAKRPAPFVLPSARLRRDSSSTESTPHHQLPAYLHGGVVVGDRKQVLSCFHRKRRTDHSKGRERRRDKLTRQICKSIHPPVITLWLYV